MQRLRSIEPVSGEIACVNGAYAERVPLLSAVVAQGTAAAAVACLIAVIPKEVGISTYPVHWALLQGFLAAAVGYSLRMETWWIPIHTLFSPGLVWALSFKLPPEFAFVLFCLLVSIYSGVSRNRVPLFLSSKVAAQAVAGLLPRDRSFTFIDVGSGLGGVLAHLARARPAGRYHGVEVAPVPFLLCRLRFALTGGNCQVEWKDFRNLDFGKYDVIYVYLSPAAMPGLWEKASREMRPGSLLLSNSFSVPGARPALTLATGAGSGSQLLGWQM
jgi:hypothetical protein